jgi:hypothetical protein
VTVGFPPVADLLEPFGVPGSVPKADSPSGLVLHRHKEEELPVRDDATQGVRGS